MGVAKTQGHNRASAATKSQYSRPTKHSLDQVQSYLGDDPDCRGWISQRDQPIETYPGETIFYSKETVEIAEELTREHMIPVKEAVLAMADRMRNRASPAATSVPTTPTAPIPGQGDRDQFRLVVTDATPRAWASGDKIDNVNANAPRPSGTDNLIAPEPGAGNQPPTMEVMRVQPGQAQAPHQQRGHVIASAEPSPVVEGVLVSEKDAEYWVSRINNHLAEGVKGLVEAGRDFRDAKAKLEHGEFKSMFESGRLRISQRTAELLMEVARHPVLSNPNNYSILPPTLTALNALSHVAEAGLKKAIDDNKIKPDMTIANARALVAGLREDRNKRPSAELEAKLCERRLKMLARFVEEAKGWSVATRQRFLQEWQKLAATLID